MLQKFKVEDRHRPGLLQPFSFPNWKWKVVFMDFITKIPRTSKKRDSIMALVDMLTQFAHFIPINPLTREPTLLIFI
jgi:hypothetical protein